MKFLAREIFLVMLVAAAAAAAPAFAEPSGLTRWVCWNNLDTTLRCGLSEAATDGDAAEQAVKIAQPVPGAKPLPTSVRKIIRADESILGREVAIPMFDYPESEWMAEQLASFSVCFGKNDCRVTYWRPVSLVAMLD